MKRHILILLISVTFFSGQSIAQSEMLDNGFSIKFAFAFPQSSYGFDGDIPIPSGLEVSNGFGIELGNQWYLMEQESFGLALDVNWLDLQYSFSKTNDATYGDLKRITLEGSLLEFGPLATLALNDKFAIDGYYNLRPTFMVSYFYENTDDFVLLNDFTFAHALGLGIRFNILYVGYEYTFGGFSGEIISEGEFDEVADLYDRQDMSGMASKLIIGLQF